MIRRALTLSLGMWALLAAPATAATVAVIADSGGETLKVTGGPGETNVVSVAVNTINKYFVVTDPGAPMTAGSGCLGPAGGPIVCSADLDAADVVLELGDGDDVASSTLPRGIRMIAWGGTGDDEIDAGDGDDVLQGGPGDDVLDGGFGRDVADYSEHTDGVVVDVTSPGAAGSTGERDTLSSIEGARGGSGDDRIKAPPRNVACGDGHDRLTPLGNSGLRAPADCELLAFAAGLAVERTARLRGRRLELRAWVGRTATLRVRAGGRVVSRRVDPGFSTRQRVRFTLPARAAASVRRSGLVRVTARGTTLALRVRR